MITVCLFACAILTVGLYASAIVAVGNLDLQRALHSLIAAAFVLAASFAVLLFD